MKEVLKYFSPKSCSMARKNGENRDPSKPMSSLSFRRPQPSRHFESYWTLNSLPKESSLLVSRRRKGKGYSKYFRTSFITKQSLYLPYWDSVSWIFYWRLWRMVNSSSGRPQRSACMLKSNILACDFKWPYRCYWLPLSCGQLTHLDEISLHSLNL